MLRSNSKSLGNHVISPEEDKKLSYRRGTARCVMSIEILPIATQQCRNYLGYTTSLDQIDAMKLEI